MSQKKCQKISSCWAGNLRATFKILNNFSFYWSLIERISCLSRFTCSENWWILNFSYLFLYIVCGVQKEPLYDSGDIRTERMLKQRLLDRRFCTNYGKPTFQNLTIFSKRSSTTRACEINKHYLGEPTIIAKMLGKSLLSRILLNKFYILYNENSDWNTLTNSSRG